MTQEQEKLVEFTEDMRRRIRAAIARLAAGAAPMRIPVDTTDPDVVLSDCETVLDLQAGALRALLREREVFQVQLDVAHESLRLAHAQTADAQREIEHLRQAARTLEQIHQEAREREGSVMHELEAQLQAAQEAAVSIAADKHATEAQLQVERENGARWERAYRTQVEATEAWQLNAEMAAEALSAETEARKRAEAELSKLRAGFADSIEAREAHDGRSLEEV